METWKSIIKPAEDSNKQQVEQEADVIISSVIIGFSGTRYYQQQPCTFDIEWEQISEKDKKDMEADSAGRVGIEKWAYKNAQGQQDFLTTIECVSKVMDIYQPGMGDWLIDGQSQKTGKGELITGRQGGASQNKQQRDKSPQSSQAKALVKNLSDNQWLALDTGGNKLIYKGRGAYSGIIDDPVQKVAYHEDAKTNVRPTLRVFRNDKRWLPTGTTKKITNDGVIQADDHDRAKPAPYGILGGIENGRDGNDNPIPIHYRNLQPISSDGMGALPEIFNNTKVGYIHGMCTAINMCNKHGGWSTPYEVATGDQTTKISSCFPCTTYMYATGFPPSSAHLGRGESWVPPISDDIPAISGDSYPVSKAVGNKSITEGDEGIQSTFDKEVCDSYKNKWNSDIFDYLTLGTEIVLNGNKRLNERLKENLKEDLEYFGLEVVPILSDGYKEIFDKLLAATKEDAGRMFLDALTIHDSEWKRLKRTFFPLWKRERGKELLRDENKAGMLKKKI